MHNAHHRIDRTMVFGLIIVDVILINLCFLAAYRLRYEQEFIVPVLEANYVPYSDYVPVAFLLTILLLVTYKLEGLYDFSRSRSWLDAVYAIFSGTAIGIALLTVFFFYYRPLVYSRLMFGYSGILILICLSFVRLLENTFLRALHRRGIGTTRTLIVGAGEMGRTIMRNVVAQPELGYLILGFVDDDPAKQRTQIGRFKALGTTEHLPQVVQEHHIEEVIVTLPSTSHQRILEIMTWCNTLGARVRIVPDLFQMSLNRLDLEVINGIPVIGVREITIRGFNLAIKRALDVLISGSLLLLTSPLLALMALLIPRDSPGPVLFRQIRVGRRGKPFVFYKFRTMVADAEAQRPHLDTLNQATGPLFKMRDDPRRTRLGRLLRRTSLDELPQLFNVLRGEMSLVGPRPPLPLEVEQYEDWHRRRLDISPGMTGLWQVSGRSELTFDEMVMLDLYYAENWSLWLDLQILFKTIPTVILGTGAY
ncbi:MAG: undecaprenyl-phosphate glucose phosphotransferase [Chloroflexi bacterium]|nr:undecaprenyl-phosphate glucose phosphotransferase [Chloroflexota bacterium]